MSANDETALARQITHIERTLAVFHPAGPEGYAVEVRAIRHGGRGATSLVSASLPELARWAAAADGSGKYMGVYFLLNPLRPDLAGSTSSCKKVDVAARRWLPLDIEAHRPKSTAATEAELAAAWGVLLRCRSLLEGAGLSGAVVGLSGNGWHLCYPLELANDDAAQALIKETLAQMGARASDPAPEPAQKELLKNGTPLDVPLAHVDPVNHDAPRPWKLYGTMARKGEATADRPHRYARLIEGEPWSAVVAQQNTALLRELLECWRCAEDQRRGRPPDATGSTVERARKYVEKMPGGVQGDHGSDPTFKVAQVLARGFSLSRDQSWPILLAYNARCDPPWSEKELLHKIEDAEQNSRLPQGYLLRENSNGQPPALPPSPPSGNGKAALADSPCSLQTTRLDSVEVTPVRWLVPGMIPLGKLTMIAGDGGHGKSSVTLDLIASLTTGRACLGLDFVTHEPCECLLISCEDDLADTVVPRLMAAGADLAKVRHVDGIVDGQGKLSSFSLAHYEVLERHLEANPGCRLVVIDPAGAYIGQAGIDDHKDSELRALLAPLSVLAARRHVSIVIVKHLNKGTGLRAAARVGGSVGYINAVRSALLVAPDPEDDTRKFLLPLKNNLARKPTGLAFQLCDLPQQDIDVVLSPLPYLSDHDRCELGKQLYRVVWLGTVTMTADDALAPPDRKKQADDSERAACWLRDHLAGGRQPSLDCRDKGNRALQISKDLKWWRDTILKERLGGKPAKTGFGSEQVWWFVLPENPENPENPAVILGFSAASQPPAAGGTAENPPKTPENAAGFSASQDSQDSQQQADLDIDEVFPITFD